MILTPALTHSELDVTPFQSLHMSFFHLKPFISPLKLDPFLFLHLIPDVKRLVSDIEWTHMFCIFFLIFFRFIYFWDRERQSMNRGGAEIEGDTESETGSRLQAVSTEPNTGLEPTNREIMTWAEVGHSTDWATQAPRYIFLMYHPHLYPCVSLIIEQLGN